MEEEIFGAVKAAEYLGISYASVKHHLYYAHDLIPDMRIGNRLIFYKSTLDKFNKQKRKRGYQHERLETKSDSTYIQPLDRLREKKRGV